MALEWLEYVTDLKDWQRMTTYNTFLFTLVICLSYAWLRSCRTVRGKLPPGPKGLPIVGYLPYLGANEQIMFRDLSEIYGSIVRVGVCGQNLIILNDLDSIKEGITKREVLNRPINILFEQAGLSGVATLNGDVWVANRRFCLHVLRDLGFGKKSMEEHINEESQYLLSKIIESRGAPLQIQDYLVPSMSNNITALVFGTRYPYEDPRRKFLDDTLRRVLRIFSSSSLVSFLPLLLNKIALVLPFMSAGALRKVLVDIQDYISKEAVAHRETLQEHSNRDFIDGYLKKMREHENDPASPFTMRRLLGNVLNFFGAGSNTVQLSITWHMLNCAARVEEVQVKIQKEIDEVMGLERAPAWEDRNKMPYTMATIWEMYRWRTIAPLGIARGVAEDTYLREYYIPKGSIVMPNLWAVHNDPSVWEDPDEFDPGRFLKKDGTQLADRPEHLIPFSIGKRMCPAETLATMEIFLYLTSILQRFTVVPEEGKSIDLTSKCQFLCFPSPQLLRFIPRR